MEPLKNQWGSVKVYIRHTKECPESETPDEQAKCHCAKWLYEYQREGKPIRRSLNTYSWPEALREATRVLDGFNPEIAKARAAEEQKKREVMTVHDAAQIWLDKTKNEHGEGQTLKKYQGVVSKLEDWAGRKRIEYIQDIKPVDLAAWYQTTAWTDYADSTRQVWWANLRMMFKLLHEMKVVADNPIVAIKAAKPKGEHVQGPYTDEQIDAMFAHIDAAGELIPEKRRAEGVQRLRAFLTLLLHSGCDPIDAVRFRQDMIEPTQVGKRKVSVFRYRRSKTGVMAVVPLADGVVKVIRSAPPCTRGPEGMPFRCCPDTQIESDLADYSKQIRAVLKAAGVRWVVLPPDRDGRVRRKAANIKQLRHTFAIRMLLAKHSEETVARMLGHKNTVMLRKHYAPFIPRLDEMHVQTVVEKWA